ncbi:aspartyl protease [Thermoascus aurantiacus ATCC 26904]
MWGASLLSLTLFLALPAVDSLLLRKSDEPAVVGLDIQRKHVPNPVSRDHRRRKRIKAVDQVLDNEQTLYFCNITLGTPGQHLRLSIDTGSSDLWCNSASSRLCSSRRDLCNASGTYDANSSSTYKYVSSDFNISYVDGSAAIGDYVTDSLHIGGVTLTDFQFGIGYSSSSPEGVLGIGYTLNEVQVNRNGKAPYPNLPQALVKEGFIKSNAYSLWLNDLDANTGSILFGGVNTEKYHGQLETLPIQRVNGEYAEFIIALTGLALNTSSSSHAYTSEALPAAVLLDSGSSLSYLPDSLVAKIYDDLDVTYDSSSQTGYVPCDLMNQEISFSFTFSSPSISVGIDELVLDPGTNPDGSRPTFLDGTPACVFGIAPAGDSIAVLGDTFLRSAYVVYDLANNEISLANTNFNSTRDNIMEIGTGEDAVPDAIRVKNPVTTVAVGVGGARIGGPSGTGVVLSGALPTATSTGAAFMATSVPKHLAAGVAGAGLIFVL